MRVCRLLAALAALLALACGSAAPPPAEAGGRRPAKAKAPGQEGVPALDAALVARVPQGTFGPYVGHSGERALLVWAAQEATGRAWYSLPVDGSGQPQGEARRIAAAPSEIGVVVVRHLGQNQFGVASTRRTATGEQIELMLVGSDGKPLGSARRLASTAGPVLWVDAARVKSQRTVLWAVQGNDGADVYALPVSERGEPQGQPQKSAAGVRAWQTAVLGEHLALGVVRSSSEPGKSGPVEVFWLDGRGQAVRKPTVVAPGGTAELDLDLAAVGERLVVMFTDRRSGEGRLMAAAVAADGSVAVPVGPFVQPLGEQALLRVTAQGKRGYAVWENVSLPDGMGRSFEVATFGPEARAGGDMARILYASFDGSVPEVTATQGGVVFLTLSPACLRGKRCEADDAMPAYLALDEKLDPVAFEPVRLNALDGQAPDLGWGLTCMAGSCFLLSAQNATPAPVFLTQLSPRSNAWQAPWSKPALEPAPRVVMSEILASTDALATLAVRSGDAPLLAWLTDFDPTTPWVRLKKPASDGRYDPLRATLAFTSLAGAAPPLPKEKELSLRAHSLSGIALSPGRSADETIAAWAGVDGGQPQVFLTRLGPDGAKREQRMLTRKQGGLSDVGIVAVDGGHVVGWLDERSGAPQLYSARVNQALNRVGGEQRPKTSGDSPAELSLASLGSLVLAVWSDASGEERADLFGRILSPKDASPLGDEIRLSETTQHSFSPALCPRGDETVVAWLERADAGEGGHAAMLGVLGVDGNWKESPERVAFEGGTPAALGLDCSAAATRVAVLVESSERWGLSVFERTGGRTGSPKVVLRLTRGARGALRPVVRGDQIYLADAAPGGGDRIRRVKLAWR